MEDFLYAYNQPKKFGKYDLILDGKITANEIVYKVLTEDNDIENINLADKVKELESRLQTHFTFETVTELPTEGKETVIYLVANDEESGDKDSYNEYMWVKGKGFELIGSGTYAQQQADLDAEVKRATEKEKELSDAITNETERATEKEASIDAELAKRVPYTLHKSVSVVGNVKDVVKLDVPESSNEAMYCPQGLIMGGTALAAGLVTRGICGSGIPNDSGSCGKENLYINYDGDTTYSPYRQLIIQADRIGDDYGHNLYQYAAARGDAVKGYVDEKIENRVVINDPITITEGDNTTSITSDTISTTTLTGTLDAESMKNSLTAEAIQNVAPIAWGYLNVQAKKLDNSSLAVAVGNDAYVVAEGVALGYNAKAHQWNGTAVGFGAEVKGSRSIVLTGRGGKVLKPTAITIGSQFIETTDSEDVTHYCTTEGTGSITIGAGANTKNTTKTVEGVETTVESSNAITIGCKADNSGADSVVIGAQARNGSSASVAIGAGAAAASMKGTSIGTKAISSFNGFAAGYESLTNGVNSVAIGAGAQSFASNTVLIGTSATIANNPSATYDNTTVIGYGAKASAPNAVVLGAGANTEGSESVVIGTSSKNKALGSVAVGAGAGSTEKGYTYSVALGHASKNTGQDSTAIGSSSTAALQAVALGRAANATTNYAIAIGAGSRALGKRTAALGSNARAADTGCITFASWSEETGGINTKTQLYFSGANTPLANTYEDGEAMMGYVVTDKDGNTMAAGTQKLSVLFPNNSTFQPATIDENGEWVMPKVFHPSDLDLPIEEPSENNDVEINIPTIEEEYKPLPIYPIVEPTIEEITE